MSKRDAIMEQFQWKQMMLDLRTAGLKFRELSEALGISKGACHDLMSGRSKQPTGNVALKLIELHRRNRRKIHANDHR
jgi:hypothetical protein